MPPKKSTKSSNKRPPFSTSTGLAQSTIASYFSGDKRKRELVENKFEDSKEVEEATVSDEEFEFEPDTQKETQTENRSLPKPKKTKTKVVENTQDEKQKGDESSCEKVTKEMDVKGIARVSEEKFCDQTPGKKNEKIKVKQSLVVEEEEKEFEIGGNMENNGKVEHNQREVKNEIENEVKDEIENEIQDEIEDEIENEVKDEKKRKPKSKTQSKSKKPASFQSSAKTLELEDWTSSWTSPKGVPYSALCKIFSAIEEVSGRLLILDKLTGFFRAILQKFPNDLLPCVYLCVNKLASAFMGVEIGIGDASLIKSLSEATGRTADAIKADLNRIGDLGSVAQESRTTQRTLFPPPPLFITDVYQGFLSIAREQGNASLSKKVGTIKKLLVSCRTGDEAKYLIRGLQGKLRIGLAEQSVLVALAHAAKIHCNPEVLQLDDEFLKEELESAVLLVKRVFSECPSYEDMISSILKSGFDEIEQDCKFRAGLPVRPMLAKPTKGLQEVFERFVNSKFTCEFKYDGERGQVHYLSDGTVKIFSRNLEDNTEKYPDIINRLRNCIKDGVSDFVLDCEVVAWDTEKKALLPFQTLSTRARKAVESSTIRVQVILLAFDLLYLNGQSLLQRPLFERRELLLQSFCEIENELQFAVHMESSDVEELEEFFRESIKQNCEGLMVKTLEEDATYEPSKRSMKWLKVKKDYLDGLSDTLDLVPIGGYLGKGKRTGVYGAYLLACYDPENEEFQSICKIGTGLSDADLSFHSESLNKLALDQQPANYIVSEKLYPDAWFRAEQVWEIKAADLTISPIHHAANGMMPSGKGIALRFPRFIRIRQDKDAEDATSVSQVLEMYNNQAAAQKYGHDEEDY